MKTIITVITILFFVNSLTAQIISDVSKTNVIQCEKFFITKPLREIKNSNNPKILKADNEAADKFRRLQFKYNYDNLLSEPEDAVLQNKNGVKLLVVPDVNWQGYEADYYPPDPTGAAGTNHFVQAVNSSYLVFDKKGKNILGPISFVDIFGSDNGDPIVLYDKYADRWLITEFGSHSAKKLIIAVSKTSDPTGQYYIYQFSSPQFPDYPKYSIWDDGYYMTSNQLPYPMQLFVFERDKMLNGDNTARAVYNSYTPPKNTIQFCVPLPADADGQLPPGGAPCPIFCIEDNNTGGTADQIVIFDASVNWVPLTPVLSITLNTKLAVSPFNSYCTGNDVSQPGTTAKLDAISESFMFRAQYRRWTGYNTVVLNQTVKVSSHWGIRWYELRQNTSTGVWSIYQQSTFSPDNLSRWMGSIAMDDNGSIGLGYSITGVDTAKNVYPGIRFTGRLSTDSLNTMTFAEQTATDGKKSLVNKIGRFGDYSQMSIDPVDGKVFWFTGEYSDIINAQDNGDATRIFSFRIPYSFNDIKNVQNQSDFNIITTNEAIKIQAANLPINVELYVELFDINGRYIYGKKINLISNYIETSINTASISKGVYFLRIGSMNSSFQRVKKVIVE